MLKLVLVNLPETKEQAADFHTVPLLDLRRAVLPLLGRLLGHSLLKNIPDELDVFLGHKDFLARNRGIFLGFIYLYFF